MMYTAIRFQYRDDRCGPIRKFHLLHAAHRSFPVCESSSAIFSFRANGTGLGLKNCGTALSLIFKRAVTPLIVPRLPSNHDEYFVRSLSNLSTGSKKIRLTCPLSNFKTDNQSRPVNTGPSFPVITTGNTAFWSRRSNLNLTFSNNRNFVPGIAA